MQNAEHEPRFSPRAEGIRKLGRGKDLRPPSVQEQFGDNLLRDSKLPDPDPIALKRPA